MHLVQKSTGLHCEHYVEVKETLTDCTYKTMYMYLHSNNTKKRCLRILKYRLSKPITLLNMYYDKKKSNPNKFFSKENVVNAIKEYVLCFLKYTKD